MLPVRHASGHCRGSAKRLVDSTKVVREEAQRQRLTVLLQRLWKAFINRVNHFMLIFMVSADHVAGAYLSTW